MTEMTARYPKVKYTSIWCFYLYYCWLSQRVNISVILFQRYVELLNIPDGVPKVLFIYLVLPQLFLFSFIVIYFVILNLLNILCSVMFQCEVTKGSGIYMSVHDKNAVKLSGNGNPAQMVRDCLTKLIGLEVMESTHLTAMGTKQGTIGIKESVRCAILGKSSFTK